MCNAQYSICMISSRLFGYLLVLLDDDAGTISTSVKKSNVLIIWPGSTVSIQSKPLAEMEGKISVHIHFLTTRPRHTAKMHHTTPCEVGFGELGPRAYHHKAHGIGGQATKCPDSGTLNVPSNGGRIFHWLSSPSVPFFQPGGRRTLVPIVPLD